jgi:hypothetical protein
MIEGSLRFKSKYSLRLPLLYVFVFLIITQGNNIVNSDFPKLSSWLIFAYILLVGILFYSFFCFSIQIKGEEIFFFYSPFIIIRRVVKYNINEIDKFEIINFRGKGVFPHIKIYKKSKRNFTHYYSFIRNESLIELSDYLTKSGIRSEYKTDGLLRKDQVNL